MRVAEDGDEDGEQDEVRGGGDLNKIIKFIFLNIGCANKMHAVCLLLIFVQYRTAMFIDDWKL